MMNHSLELLTFSLKDSSFNSATADIDIGFMWQDLGHGETEE